MNHMYLIFKFFLINLCFSLLANEKIAYFDGKNYIANGVSEQNSEVLASTEACSSARRELISFVFGSGYKINQNIVKNLGSIDYSQDISIQSGNILLRTVQSETNKSNDITKCTLTYPKEEADHEIKRLNNLETNPNLAFTEIGSDNNFKTGSLEISTIPEDAEIYIDEVRWGETPLKLNSKLAFGKHKVVLVHDNYKIEEVEINVKGINKIIIKKLLKRATGLLNIMTNPSSAKIKINGEEIGNSPIINHKLLSGQSIHVEIQHSEAEKFSQDLELGRDEERTLNIDLPLRPAYFKLNLSSDKNIKIVIDDKTTESFIADKFIQVSCGSHKITIYKDGHEPYELNLNLSAGEKKYIPYISLIEKSISEPPGPPEVLLKSFQWGYRPFANDFGKKSFYLLPISYNHFSNNWFSSGIDFKLGLENVGTDTAVNYKHKTDVSINEILWPIHSSSFSLGIGIDYNYRVVSYDQYEQSDLFANNKKVFHPEKYSSIGYIGDLQIPLGNISRSTLGIEINYRVLDYKNKINSTSVGFYLEY